MDILSDLGNTRYAHMLDQEPGPVMVVAAAEDLAAEDLAAAEIWQLQ